MTIRATKSSIVPVMTPSNESNSVRRSRVHLLRPRGVAALAAVMFAGPALVGCTQLASLTPVAGDVVAGVGFATKDVLLNEKVQMKIVPVCEGKKPKFTCTGQTLDGQKIVSTTSESDVDQLTVTVGDKQIFEGSVEEVITKAGRTS